MKSQAYKLGNFLFKQNTLATGIDDIDQKVKDYVNDSLNTLDLENISELKITEDEKKDFQLPNVTPPKQADIEKIQQLQEEIKGIKDAKLEAEKDQKKKEELIKLIEVPEKFLHATKVKLQEIVQSQKLKEVMDSLEVEKKGKNGLTEQQQGDYYVGQIAQKEQDANELESQIQAFKNTQKERLQLIIDSKDTDIKDVTNKLKQRTAQEQLLVAINDAIQGAMPEQFCWKPSPSIPTKCPDSHPERSMALCYQTCDQAKPDKWKTKVFEKDWANVCYEQCGQIDPDKKVVIKEDNCKSRLFMIRHKEGFTNWNFKRSYIPSSKTNFNPSIKCGEGEEKWGPLCLNKFQCEDIGFERCTGAGCSITSKDCSKTLFDMISSVGLVFLKSLSIFIGPISLLAQNLAKVFLMMTKAAKLGYDMLKGWQAATEGMIFMSAETERGKILRENLFKRAYTLLQRNGDAKDLIEKFKLSDVIVQELIRLDFYVQVANFKKIQLAYKGKDAKGDEKYDFIKGFTTEITDKASKIIQNNVVKADQFIDKQSGLKIVAGTVIGEGLAVTYGILNIEKNMKDAQAAKIAKATGVENTNFDFANFEYESFLNPSWIVDSISLFTACSEWWKKDKSKKGPEGMACAKAAVGLIANFDPLGIAAAAKSFMWNRCNDLNYADTKSNIAEAAVKDRIAAADAKADAKDAKATGTTATSGATGATATTGSAKTDNKAPQPAQQPAAAAKKGK